MSDASPASAKPPRVTLSLLAEDDSRKGVPERMFRGQLTILTPLGLPALDRMLIETAHAIPATRIISSMVSNVVPALALALLRPESTIVFHHIDAFYTELAVKLAARHGLTNLQSICAPNVPEEGPAPELLLMQTRQDGVVGLTMELLRQAHLRLAPGGKLLITTNNTRDKWLSERLTDIFGTLTLAARGRKGRVYLSKRKGKPTAEELAAAGPLIFYTKEIDVEFYGTELKFETAYGTFSGDAIDTGSFALLETLREQGPLPAILDLGCGWGGLGLTAALLHETQALTMIDSNARAVEMARRNAARHGLAERAQVRLEADCGSVLNDPSEHGRYDAVITNPPYATEFRVVDIFLRAAHAALKVGGGLWLVGREHSEVTDRAQALFGNVELIKRRTYVICHCRRRAD